MYNKLREKVNKTKEDTQKLEEHKNCPCLLKHREQVYDSINAQR